VEHEKGKWKPGILAVEAEWPPWTVPLALQMHSEYYCLRSIALL